MYIRHKQVDQSTFRLSTPWFHLAPAVGPYRSRFGSDKGIGFVLPVALIRPRRADGVSYGRGPPV